MVAFPGGFNEGVRAEGRENALTLALRAKPPPLPHHCAGGVAGDLAIPLSVKLELELGTYE